LYRSEVAGRRILVMLDNARDSAQLTSDEAHQLLASRLGADRLTAEAGAVAEIWPSFLL